jgi:hypothetical protein
LVSFIFLAMASEMGRGDGGLLNNLEQFLNDGAVHGRRARGKPQEGRARREGS